MTAVEPVLLALKRALDRIYGEKGIDLRVSADAGLKFQGEKQDLEEMAGNLMDNACKWAKGSVAVSVERLAENGHLAVTVDGRRAGLDHGAARAGRQTGSAPR